MKHEQKYQQHYTHTFCLFLIVIIGIIGSGGCGQKGSIKIGFSGCLTGRLSDLGIAGRNGVMLAVEQINQSGGINGRPVELIIKDDQHDPGVAVRVDQELIEEGVAAIIGHMTSTISMAVVPLIDTKKMLLLSPTTSTDKLSHRDDYFFRIMPPSKTTSDRMAEYIFQKRGLQSIVCVHDLSNQTYTEGWYRDFKTTFEEMGGQMRAAITFTSEGTPSYLKIAEQVLHEQADGVTIVAGALDTAMIAQQIRKLNQDISLFASGWAYTFDLIQHGGTAVEGMTLAHTFSIANTRAPFLRFRQQFQDRFKTEPGFAATFGYEATIILFEALKENDEKSELKKTILFQAEFSGASR